MENSLFNTALGSMPAKATTPMRHGRPDQQLADALTKVSPQTQKKAKASAQDFEAMFLNSMFSQMTSSVKGEGPFGDTVGTGAWRSMLTDQYSRSFAKAGGGVGVGDVAALNLDVDAAHDAFGHRMRRCQHREVDLQHGAKHVVMTVQRGQQFGSGLRQIFVAGLQVPDHADIAARQIGLLRLQPHRLANLAGANQFGFALDNAEQRAHDLHHGLGELARLGGR